MTREEAKEYLYDIVDMFGTMGIEDLTEKDADKALTAIDTLADVPDTKVGEWIKVMEGNAYRDKCSRCSETYPNAYGYNFCPNCGVRMKREQNHLGKKSDLVILDEVKYE